MSGRRISVAVLLLVCGVAGALLAGLSLADMFLPRPYDGVVLESDAPGRLVIRQVVPGTGAAAAGIRAGERILGIDREVLESPAHAARILNRHVVGDRIPYLVSGPAGPREVEVTLGPRRIGNPAYLYVAVLGLLFFLVGVFVVARQPALRPARVFFFMSLLFMLFLVCRLRPASYSWVDSFVLTTGTVAFLFLPSTFLHFFLIFPREVWSWRKDPLARLAGWLVRNRLLLPLLYLVPPVVYAASVVVPGRQGREVALISGAPMPSWWLMGVYMLLGLGALASSAFAFPEPRERRGARIVFVGTVFGVVPFLVLAVLAPSILRTEKYLLWGVAPLVLVPVTFAYAIVRFELLHIKVLLRKSLMYTVVTALVTVLYAAAISAVSAASVGSRLAASPLFPILFALVIVFLFEPLRHRLQEPLERFFFAEKAKLQEAMTELGRDLTLQVDPQQVVRGLVERLPGLLNIHFAGLYLVQGEFLERRAGPKELPGHLPVPRPLVDYLQKRGRVTRIEQLGPLRALSARVDALLNALSSRGVQAVGALGSTRGFLGMVVISGKTGQTQFEPEELDLLQQLLNQAAMGLETGLLLEERARRAQLDRELAIAASIQQSLLPGEVELAEGWRVAAVCQPAQEVGGDFFTLLPCPSPDGSALVYGDVSGKSIPGALMMMAAHEVLHSLAIADPDPERLLELANQRLYSLGKRSFVALGYLGAAPGNGTLRYALAGQPPLLRRRRDGTVEELPLPEHRVPLGAFRKGRYRILEVQLEPGDLVLAYSDGVLEGQSPQGEMFGWERLAQVVAGAGGEPDTVVRSVVAAVREFSGGGPAYDDLTVVAVAPVEVRG